MYIGFEAISIRIRLQALVNNKITEIPSSETSQHVPQFCYFLSEI